MSLKASLSQIPNYVRIPTVVRANPAVSASAAAILTAFVAYDSSTVVPPQDAGIRTEYTLSGAKISTVGAGLKFHSPYPIGSITSEPVRFVEKAITVDVISSDGQSYKIPVTFYHRLKVAANKDQVLTDADIGSNNTVLLKVYFDYPNYLTELEKNFRSSIVQAMGGVQLLDVPTKAAANETIIRKDFLDRLTLNGMPIEVDEHRINIGKPEYGTDIAEKLSKVADAQRAVRAAELDVDAANHEKDAMAARASGQSQSLNNVRVNMVSLAKDLTAAFGGDSQAAAQVMTFVGPGRAEMPAVFGGNGIGMVNLPPRRADLTPIHPTTAPAATPAPAK